MGRVRTDHEVMDDWDEGISGSVVREDRLIHVEHVWGTAVTINIAGTAEREQEALAAVAECLRFFAQVDMIFSTYKPVTEVAFYRAGLERPGRHSKEFEQVMRACRELRTVTNGAFDPWSVAGGYDPSGYVKGWAAGGASSRMTAAGFAHHLVNAAGDICARGDEVPGSGRGWPVGILNPHSLAEVIEVVTLRNESMATSGRYERGDHVVDPETGSPAVGVDSATVVGPNSGTADAAASAAMVDGLGSVEWFADLGPGWSLCLVLGEEVHTYGPAFGEPDAGA
jgi:thiamine biosynthesis lipoprotein